MQGIYTIKNIANGKVYIGKSKDIVGRWGAHVGGLLKNKHGNEHLQRSWNKYGRENFYFTILEEVELENQGEREKYWIKYYQSTDGQYGYNKTHGGDGGGVPNEDTLKKLSLASSGKNNAMYGKKGELATFWGKEHTQVTKTRIKVGQIGKEIPEDVKKKQGKKSRELRQKLNDSQVLEILEKSKQGKSSRSLSKEYNVVPSVISNIKNNKTYTHIQRDKYWLEYIKNQKPINYKSGRKQILTKKEILEIIDLLKSCRYSYWELGEFYNVSQGTISGVKNKLKKGEYNDKNS